MFFDVFFSGEIRVEIISELVYVIVKDLIFVGIVFGIEIIVIRGGILYVCYGGGGNGWGFYGLNVINIGLVYVFLVDIYKLIVVVIEG